MRAPRVFSALATASVRTHNQSSIAFWRYASLMLALLAPMAQAQTNYVYVSNQSTAGNTISGFSVDHAGLLTSLGTPVATGGTGATVLCSGVDRMVVNGTTNLLFVANSGNQPTFVGNKNIYMEAIDSKDNLNSGWTQLGTWNLP